MQWDKAKHMYFSDIPVTDISSELDLPLNELSVRIFGADRTGHHPDCWYQERKKVAPHSFVTYQKVKPYLLSMAESKISKMIIEGTDRIESMGGIKNIDELSTAVEIVTKLDKMGRLERGEATENIAVEHGMTLRDIANGKQLVEVTPEEPTPRLPTPPLSDPSDSEDTDESLTPDS